MVYTPDTKNNMSFTNGRTFWFLFNIDFVSFIEYAKYNPKIPLTMKFPGVDVCGEFDQKLLVIGKVPEGSSENPEIVFHGHDGAEAFHIHIDIENKFIDRWGVFDGEESKKEGNPGDGTTIGFDEPFVLV